MTTAKEYWKERFEEYPHTDADKLAVVMMAEYAEKVAKQPITTCDTGKLRPCDCKDAVDASKLQEQGISHNDEGIKVLPNYVLLTMGHTEIKISMSRFKMFAEWYLNPQEKK